MKNLVHVLLLVLASFPTLAQEGGNGSKTQTSKIKSEEILDLKIYDNSLDPFYFNETDEFDNGLLQSAAVRLRVKANIDWQVTFSTQQEYFTSATETPMPVSILSLGKTGEALQALSTSQSETPLAIGTNGDDTKENHKFDIDIKTDPGYNYDPGVYDVEIIYTISAR